MIPRTCRPALERLEDRTTPSTSMGPQFLPGLKPGAYAPDHIMVGDLNGKVHEIPLAKGVSVEQALAAYRAQPGVKYAEPDWLVHTSVLPNDPLFNQQYGLNNTGQDINGLPGTPDADIDAPEAWNITTGSAKTVVASIDTGVDYDHPDLYLNIWINQGEIPTAIKNQLTDTDGDGLITFYDLNNPINQGPGKISDWNLDGRIDGGDLLNNSSGWENNADTDGDGYVDDLIGWNFVYNTNDPMDDNGHGTHTSGIMGAIGNNNTGVSGVNWHVQIAAMKFISAGGTGELSGAESALNLCVAKGILISNNSWGGAEYSQSFVNALIAANDAGHIFVAAAGNNFSNNDQVPEYPANFEVDNVISVAATDQDDQLAWFSNYGTTTVDIAAPGVSVLSTLPDGNYNYLDGTSMAAPHVAGVVGLLRSKDPTLTVSQITGLLYAYADVIPELESTVAGGRRLNAYGALTGTPPPPPSPYVLSSSPSGFSISPLNYIDFKFNVAMDTASFSVAGDVVSFTGPAGNLINQITGFSWQPGNHTLRVTFNEQTIEGKYTMVIGPNILAAGSGDPMDQDRDGALGETVDDRYTASVSKFKTVYYADFTNAGSPSLDGFTVDNTGAPAPGLWHLSIGHGVEPGHSASDSMYFGHNEAPDGGGDYDVGHTAGRITSPAIDLTTATVAKLSFNYILDTDGGAFFGTDIAEVQISQDGGPFDVVLTNPIGLTDPTSGWINAIIDLTPYTGHSIQVRFDFDTGDANNNFYEGWYVDDVSVAVSTKPLVTVFAADFSDAGGAASFDGFTIDNTGAPAPGLWHLSTGRGTQPGHSADDSMYYGYGEGPTGGGTYNAGDSAGRITSAPIDLINAFVAQLSFNYFLETEQFAAGGLDVATVNVSLDGGPFTGIVSNADSLIDPTLGWTSITVDLSSYVGHMVQVQFEFFTGDSLDNGFEGWYVDDVVVKAAAATTPVERDWDGGGGDNNWTTPANWVGDVAPNPGDFLVFPAGAAQLTNANDYAAGTTFGSITFSGGGYAVGGNSVMLLGGVFDTAGTNTLNTPIVMGAAQSFTVSASSALTLGGAVNNGGFLLTADVGTSGNLSFTSTISGAGGLWKKSAGTLLVSGNNTFTGASLLSSGVLAIGSNTALGTGTFTMQTATVQADGAARTLANPIVFSGTTTFAGSFNLTFTGAGTLNANRTINVNGPGLTTFSGPIGESSGSFKFSKAGAGTLRLSGANTFSGGFLLNAGTLAIGNNAALGSGTFTMQTATIQADGAARTIVNALVLNGTTTIAGSLALTFTGPATLTANRTLTVNSTALVTMSGNIGGAFKLSKTGNGTLLLSGNNTFTGGLTFAAGTFLSGSNTAAGTGLLTLVTCTVKADTVSRTLANPLSFNGTTIFAGTLDLTFTGNGTLTGSRTWQVDNTALTTFSGNIGQTSAFKITKTGAGTLQLSGTNSFSGGFQLNAGTLALGSNSALGTGTITILGGTMQANGAARTLTNAITLGNFTVAGNLDLTFTGPATLIGTRTITVTNTGLTTIAGNIGQDAAGRALIKAGAGTLVLAGANTYTGSTTINAGLLRMDGSNPASAVIVKSGGTLAGSGTVAAVQVQAGGTISPGSSPGILNTGNLQYQAGSTFTVELNGTTAGSGYDQVNVTGTISLGGSTLNISLGFTPDLFTTFVIINNDGNEFATGTFAGLPEGATFVINGMTFQITYGWGNDVALTRIG